MAPTPGAPMDAPAERHEVKVVLLGHGGVGKTCVVLSAFQRHFMNMYDPTSTLSRIVANLTKTIS